MSEFNLRSNAEILDVLYAVALGEGFMWGMSGIRDDVVSGMVLQSHETAQTLCRILLGFVIIILSWLYYRRFMLTRAHYPAAEFVTDVVVMMTYMSLFLLIDVPGPFYATVAAIWVLYGLARAPGPGFAVGRTWASWSRTWSFSQHWPQVRGRFPGRPPSGCDSSRRLLRPSPSVHWTTAWPRASGRTSLRP